MSTSLGIGIVGAGTIGRGETRTCTITNDDQPPGLKVIKNVINDNGGTATANVPAARTRFLDRLMVKHDGRVFFVKVSDVDWFEAAGNYVRVHSGKTDHLIREPDRRQPVPGPSHRGAPLVHAGVEREIPVRVVRRVDHAGFKSLLVLRFSPGLPFAALNYGAGVCGVRFGDFVFAIPIKYAVLIGSTIDKIFTQPELLIGG